MGVAHAIILTKDKKVNSICEQLGQEMGLKIESKIDIANFLLGIQENDYKIAIFDYSNIDSDNIKWIKVVRRLRPKIPLIILSEEIDKNTGGKIYDEGIFYLYIRPIVKEVFRDILKAAFALNQIGINK